VTIETELHEITAQAQRPHRLNERRKDVQILTVKVDSQTKPLVDSMYLYSTNRNI